jgi:hypothetical protein
VSTFVALMVATFAAGWVWKHTLRRVSDRAMGVMLSGAMATAGTLFGRGIPTTSSDALVLACATLLAAGATALGEWLIPEHPDVASPPEDASHAG